MKILELAGNTYILLLLHTSSSRSSVEYLDNYQKKKKKGRKAMAAIIAQITRAKRERDRRLAATATREPKCHHQLPHFQEHFKPEIHNKFLARQEVIRLKREEEELFEVQSYKKLIGIS